MIEVRIKPTRVLFFSEENYFGIYGAECNPEDEHLVNKNQYDNITIKGISPKLNMKQEYIVTLTEDLSDKRYKGTYIIENIKTKRPETIKEQKSFLETILTATQVENIYKVYKEEDDVVGLIENGEFDYEKVSGLGKKTFEKLQKKVNDNIDMSEVLAFCNQYDIKYNLVARLVKAYKNPTILMEKLKSNPYILTEVKGIGFKIADSVAKAMDYDMTSPHRIDSAIRYIISEENQSGHSWIERKTLLNRAIDLLNLTKDIIEERMDGNVKDVINVDERFTTKPVYEAEKYIAMRIKEMKDVSKKIFESEEINDFLDEYCEENNIQLDGAQKQFFHDWNENNLLFLIGSGGMGKSYLQKILLQLINKKSFSTCFLAPTGRASKVMSEYIGKQAHTIHRRIRAIDEESVNLNAIEEDIIVIDESSMCDVLIVSKLFKAITNKNSRILFIGDSAQLSSVGVGRFLHDCIDSGVVKITQLKKVFRQADGGILNVSTDVREGNHFLNDSAEGRVVFGKDCVFWLVDSQFIRDGVLSNYKKVMNKFGQDEIAILTPTNKGKLGTVELNKEIQMIANPPSPHKKEKAVGHKDYPTIFRVGDLVMNTVNSYDVDTVDDGVADIFNGDTGRIIDIDEEEKVFIIEFDGIKVKMKSGTILTNIVHAWAISIHKSQGSQYRVVIAVVDKSMTYQLNNNLMYTGFSRAKNYMLVLTQASTINKSMKKFENKNRRSFLGDLLKNGEMLID